MPVEGSELAKNLVLLRTYFYVGSRQWSSQPNQGVRQSPNSALIANQDRILNNGTIDGVYTSFLIIINAIVTISSS